MIHSIKEFDRKEFGEHLTLCGTRLKFNDEYSLKLEGITCPQCKKVLLQSLIDSCDNKIKIYNKMLSYNENDFTHTLLDEVNKEKEKYLAML